MADIADAKKQVVQRLLENTDFSISKIAAFAQVTRKYIYSFAEKYYGKDYLKQRRARSYKNEVVSNLTQEQIDELRQNMQQHAADEANGAAVQSAEPEIAEESGSGADTVHIITKPLPAAGGSSRRTLPSAGAAAKPAEGAHTRALPQTDALMSSLLGPACTAGRAQVKCGEIEVSWEEADGDLRLRGILQVLRELKGGSAA